MKRIKPVYFRDQRGFLLTFGPEDDALHRWASPLSSDRIREIFGIDSFAGIRAAAGGEGVREWMRHRLRTAMLRDMREIPGIPAAAPRVKGWPECDFSSAPRVAQLFERWAPESARVLDPFAGSGLYPTVAAQRGAETFWCEVSPVRRFLATARFRALYREDAELQQLAEDLCRLADSLPTQLEETPPDAILSLIDGRASSVVCDLFRAAIVSLLIDGERRDRETIAAELRRHARYFVAQTAMQAFPTLLCEDAADLGRMRSVHANVLLTSPPILGSRDAFSLDAEEFLSIDAAAERRRAVGGVAHVPRGRGTALHLEHAVRELRATAPLLGGESEAESLIDRLASAARAIDEPGQAAIAALYFAGLVRTSTAIEHQLASTAVAIVDAGDSWFGSRLIRNAEVVRDLFAAFGFEEVHSESVPMRLGGERAQKEHRTIVMRRGARRVQQVRGWAAWE